MVNHENTNDNSHLHLDAMLYLLEDPSLDRDAFEARLENDSQLAEILSESVTTFQSLESFESLKSVKSFTHHPVQHIPAPCNHRTNRHNRHPSWNLATSIAASIGFIGLLSWMIFETNRIQSVELASSPQNSVALRNVVSAWSDLQLDSDSALGTKGYPLNDSLNDSLNDPNYSEEELALVTHEPFSQKDVPEWLVMATAASLGNNIDANDSKVLLQ